MTEDRSAQRKSRRSNAAGARRQAPAGRSGGLSRIMIGAAVVVIIGAVALFWPQGGSMPTGIGEQQTVVTAADDSVTAGQTPRQPVRSGDVDIDQATPELVPEKPADGSTTPPVAEASRPQPQPSSTPAPATASPAGIEPQASGPYVVQAGAFGQAENADRDALRLRQNGWDARVHSGTNSDGRDVYRVWIGFFPTKPDAQAFIAQHRELLPGAIAVRR